MVVSSHIKNDITDNPRIQSHSSPETCRENHELPEKKKFREEKNNNNNNNKLIQKQSEFALQKVILWTSCYGLSPLDIKSLNTNVNKNERYHFQRIYKSGQKVINSFMFRLTKDISNTIYRALSKGLLIAYRSPLVYLNDPVNATNKLYRDLAMVHTVIRSFLHKLKK